MAVLQVNTFFIKNVQFVKINFSMNLFSEILVDDSDSTRGYQHVGFHLTQNLLSVCKYLSYPGKLLRIYSSSQLSYLKENEIKTSPIGILQKSEPDYRLNCKSPKVDDATQSCSECKYLFVSQ